MHTGRKEYGVFSLSNSLHVIPRHTLTNAHAVNRMPLVSSWIEFSIVAGLFFFMKSFKRELICWIFDSYANVLFLFLMTNFNDKIYYCRFILHTVHQQQQLATNLRKLISVFPHPFYTPPQRLWVMEWGRRMTAACLLSYTGNLCCSRETNSTAVHPWGRDFGF